MGRERHSAFGANNVSIEICAIERWSKNVKARKDIPFPHIVIMYNKIMTRADLAGVLIVLYCVEVKTKGSTLKFSGTLLKYAK